MTDDVPSCDRCGQQHVTRFGHQACTSHKQGSGVPCTQPPKHGQRICGHHGGKAPQNLAAGARMVAEQSAMATIQKLIPDNIQPIRDPVETLAMLAGEADAVRRVVAKKVNELTEIRTLDQRGAEQLHAYVMLYERSFDRTARTCEALVRSNYIERYGAIQEAQLSALLAVIQHAVRLIPDAVTRQAVTEDIAVGLRSIQATPTEIAS